VYYLDPNQNTSLAMNTTPLQIQDQQLHNRYDSAWLTADNLQLPILELSQLPTLVHLPLFGSKIRAGFPSPADDHLEASIDLNQHYVRHPAATFFVRVQGTSMIGAGIHSGDMLVVDRSLEAKSGSIIIAVVNGEMTLKRLLLSGEEVWLMPENPDFQPLQILDGMELQLWGVVAHVIHSL
jgi:DNA polymerase V